MSFYSPLCLHLIINLLLASSPPSSGPLFCKSETEFVSFWVYSSEIPFARMHGLRFTGFLDRFLQLLLIGGCFAVGDEHRYFRTHSRGATLPLCCRLDCGKVMLDAFVQSVALRIVTQSINIISRDQMGMDQVGSIRGRSMLDRSNENVTQIRLDRNPSSLPHLLPSYAPGFYQPHA